MGNKAKIWNMKTGDYNIKKNKSKNPNNAFEGIIALYSFSLSKEKIDYVIFVVQSSLAKKDTERL